MYFWRQLTLCFKFDAGTMVYLTIQSVCPLLLYYEDNMANDVVSLPKRNECFVSFFPLLHRLYIQVSSMAIWVFLNATAITTIGVHPRVACHGLLLPLPFEKDLEQGE